MRTRDGRDLANALNIVFIGLPKVAKLENTLESNTALEIGAIFLKDADDPQKCGLIQKLQRKENGLMEAHQALSQRRRLWCAQFKQEKAECDFISSINGARREARAEGRAECLAEGARKCALLADGVLPEFRNGPVSLPKRSLQ